VNQAGYGAPIAINQTEANWLFPPAPAPSSTVSLYGRNLSNGASPPTSWVYIEPVSGQAGEWARVTSVNPYKVDFVVPGDLPLGSYRVWANNGLAGPMGWSGPLSLSVSAASTWSGPTVNVKAYGATGNGSTDDGPAIQSAIAALSSGATLYFPTGNYLIANEQLNLPSNTRVLGDGMTASTLTFSTVLGTGCGQYAIGFCDGSANNVEIDSLNLVYSGAITSGALVRERSGTNLTLNQVGIQSPSLENLDWQSSSVVRLLNSKLTGQGISFILTHDIDLDQTQFLEAYNADAPLTFWGSYNVTVTGCTFQDYDETSALGWGQGRIVENNLIWGSIFNEYFGGNSSIGLGQASPGNYGEQLNAEGSQTAYDGLVLSGTATTFTVPLGTNIGGAGMSVIVTAGTGLGQMRIISGASTQANGIMVTVSSPWNVPLDSTSQIEIVTTLHDVVFYQNVLQNQPGPNGAANLQASTGLELWQGGYQIAFDGNTTNNLNSGVLLANDSTVNPCYFIDIINNQFNGSKQFGVTLQPASETAGEAAETDFVGVALRNNVVNSASVGISLLRSTQVTTGNTTLALLEHNQILDSPVGLNAFTDPTVLAYENTFELGTANSPGSVGLNFLSLTPGIQLQGNTFTGFAQPFAGTAPSSMLFLPNRVWNVTLPTVSLSSLALPISNGGTTSLAWTARVDQTWLIPASTSGNLAAESTSVIPISVSSTLLSAGSYVGHVTISNGAQAQTATVQVTVQ
jgi:hypothetical protein